MCRKLFLLVCFVLVLGLASNASALVFDNVDVGGPGLEGSADYNSVTGTWTVTGSGDDIWGGWDQFHYVFRPLPGDGTMEINLADMSMDPMHEWAKVGVMIRETLDGDSKHAAMVMTGSHGVGFVYRQNTGGGSSGPPTAVGEIWPERMRIKREGTALIGSYYSDDWMMWMDMPVVAVPVEMGDDVYIGLIVCSNDNSKLCTAVFDSITAPANYLAWRPSPADGVVGLPLDPLTLTWLPGDTAASHKVYFGTSLSDVDPDAIPTPTPVVTKGLGEESYETGALERGVTYYWRIDEVNDANVWTGPVWSFKTEGLVGYWLLDGDATDASGSGLHGTINGNVTPTTDRFGNADSAMLFPGAGNSYIELGDPPELRITGAMTLAAWVRIDSYETNGRIIARIGTQRSYSLNVEGEAYGHVGAFMVAASGSDLRIVNTADRIDFGPYEWFHIAGTFEPGVAIKIYINGQLDNVLTDNIPTTQFIANTVRIGKSGTTWGEFNGSIDDVRVYNRALSAADIYELGTRIMAYSPHPGSGAEGLPIDVQLSWLPGRDAFLHAVYFGDNYEDVLAGAGDTYQGLYEVASFDPGILDLAKTYYWAVDEIWHDGRDFGITIGSVWSFTITDHRLIEDFEPYDITPVPPDVSGLVAWYELEGDVNDSGPYGYHGTLSASGATWTIPGHDGTGSCLEFDGTGPGLVSVGTFDVVGSGITMALWFKADTVNNVDDPRMFSKATGGSGDQHWFKVGSGRPGGALRVLRFRLKTNEGPSTAELKADPEGIIDLNEWIHVAATWDASDPTMRLYKNAVEVGSRAKGGTAVATDPNVPVAIGNQPQGDRPFDGLIDDVRVYNYALSHAQVVALAIEDPNPLPDTWVDDGVVSSLELDSRHWGEQAMRVDCNGDGEVRRFVPFGDLSLGNAKALVLYFKGNPDNTAEDMYVSLTSALQSHNTGTVSYDGDINDVKIAEWQQWNLSLADFNVPLSHIGEIAIGVTGGTGTLYFDDLRLYTTRCVPKLGPYADITDDCVVDYKDIRVMAGEWLKHDYTIDPVAPPDQNEISEGYWIVGVPPDDVNHLVAHYEFEGDANDSSGNHHGTAMGGPVYVDGVFGQALDFEYDNDTSVEIYPLDVEGSGITLAGWIKLESQSRTDARIISKCNPDDSSTGGHWWKLGTNSNLRIRSRLKTGGTTVERNSSNYTLSLDAWHHVAMTYNGSHVQLYKDAQSVGSWPQSGTVDVNSSIPVAIGNHPVNGGIGFDGLIDDFRIYDSALSREELMWLVGVEPIYVPPVYGPLMAHYEFDGDANDSSGNNYHGTAMRGPVYVDGVFDQALDFEYNDNTSVEIEPFDVEGPGITIACWVKIESLSRADGRIVSKAISGATQDHWWMFSTDSNRRLRARVKRDGYTHTRKTGNYVWNFNTWHHVVMTYDNVSPKLRMYVDTKRRHNWGTSGVLDLGPTVPVAIGNTPGGGRAFDGVIDDVRIYNYAMEPLEILYLFTNGEPVYYPLVSDADLFEDEKDSMYVNFKDYAILADEWLDVLLFPAE